MAKTTLSDYEFLRCEDGIYFGRALKNGTVSKDARKVETEEIIELFTEVLQDYCLRTGKPMEIMRGGKPFVRATIVI